MSPPPRARTRRGRAGGRAVTGAAAPTLAARKPEHARANESVFYDNKLRTCNIRSNPQTSSMGKETSSFFPRERLTQRPQNSGPTSARETGRGTDTGTGTTRCSYAVGGTGPCCSSGRRPQSAQAPSGEGEEAIFCRQLFLRPKEKPFEFIRFC